MPRRHLKRATAKLASRTNAPNVSRRKTRRRTRISTFVLPYSLHLLLTLSSSQPLLRLLTHSFSATFASGHLFSTLPSALISTPDGLTWTIPSSSHTLLTSLIQSPLFVNLGRLSRAIGRLIEASASLPTASNPLALVQVQQTSTTLERLTTRVQSDWSATTWSDIPSDLSLSPATRAQTEPWTLLRSLLFSITLIHSSLLIIVSPSPGRIPTRLQLELAKQAVRVLKRSYFVAIKFGPEGFSAWRGVWVGLLEVAGQDTKEGVEEFMRELEPSRMGEFAKVAVRLCVEESADHSLGVQVNCTRGRWRGVRRRFTLMRLSI